MVYEEELIKDLFTSDDATAAGFLRSLVEKGECAHIEYKHGYTHDDGTGKENSYLKWNVLKALVGFSNKPGPVSPYAGVVLIGVHDKKGKIVGIDEDLRYAGKSEDKLELKIRNHIRDSFSDGGDNTPHEFRFVTANSEGQQVLAVSVGNSAEPLYLKPDKGPTKFLIRKGNQTNELDGRELGKYLAHNLNPRPQQQGPELDQDFKKLNDAIDADSDRMTSQDVEAALSPAVRGVSGLAQTMEAVAKDITVATEMLRTMPPEINIEAAVSVLKEHPQVVEREFSRSASGVPGWLRVVTTRVLGQFLIRLRKQLPRVKGTAARNKLQKLWVVSPWLSDLENTTKSPELSFDQLLKQVQDDRTTVYVVTRPPKSDSPHEQAVRRWEESKRANVVFLKDLHTKLYIAQLRGGAFALMGSANFTTPSLTRYQELGMLIDERGRDGTRIVKELKAEAARLYRKDGRQRFCQARL